MGIFSNALVIGTDQKNFVFRNFLYRESCYNLLLKAIEEYRANHVPPPPVYNDGGVHNQTNQLIRDNN
jgi:hypothetical protein